MLAREFDLSVIDSFHFSDFKFERFELLFRHCTTHAPTIRNLFGSSRIFCLRGIKVFPILWTDVLLRALPRTTIVRALPRMIFLLRALPRTTIVRALPRMVLWRFAISDIATLISLLWSMAYQMESSGDRGKNIFSLTNTHAFHSVASARQTPLSGYFSN